MNKRECQIIKKIVEQSNNGLSLKQLSLYYNISERSIYNSWITISNYLNNCGLSGVIILENGVFKYQETTDSLQKIYTLITTLGFYNYHLSAPERQNIILILLACQDSYLKLEHITNILYISRTTTAADMQNVKESLDSMNVLLREKKPSGFILDCNEFQRREVLFTALNNIDLVSSFPWTNTSCDPCSNFAKNIIKTDKFSHKISEAIKKSENCFNLNIPDKYFFRLVLILCIIFFRIENHHYIEFDSYPVNNSKDSTLLFARDIFTRLEDLVVFTESEVQYLAICLQEIKFLFDIPAKGTEPIELHTLVNHFIKELSNAYKINLMSDIMLHEYLTAHLASFFHRSSYNETFENPFYEDIIKQYSVDYKILKQYIYILEEGLGITFNNSEITYILMHILASIERSTKRIYIPNLIVVCNVGIGISHFLTALIEKNFHVNVITTCSVHNLPMVLRNCDCDLIISTTPLQNINIQYIQVGAFLRDSDIKKIKSTLYSLNQNKVVQQLNISPLIDENIDQNISHKTFFSNYLTKNGINLDKEVTNWKEAIIAAGQLLLSQKKISMNYLNQMVELVIKYGPYIVLAPGIAIAHAAPSDGAFETGITLVRLKTPVNFGSNTNPVKIIIALSLIDTPENVSLTLDLMNYAQQLGFVNSLCDATSEEEIIDVFKNYEQRYSK